jgi:hypothetical protein
MDKANFDGAERIDFQADEDVVVVNPNPGKPLTLNFGNREVTFYPLQKYRMGKNQLGTLCEIQETHWAEMKINAQSERQEWAKRITSASQFERDKAAKFCDKNGDPHTKPPKRPMLVRLDRANGMKWYEEGMAEQRELQSEPAKPAAPKVAEPVQAELEPEPGDIDTIELEEPKKNWNLKQLFDYCQKHGAHVDENDKDRADVLVKRAKLAFEAKKILYTEKKINFKIK